MMQPKILVIGATGKHGNTGAIVVDRLISQGRNVALLTPATMCDKTLLSCKITARR
jgi:nucleoside-diphosphate-sugar epimerase